MENKLCLIFSSSSVSAPLQSLIDHAFKQRKLFAKICKILLPAIPKATTAPGLTPDDLDVLKRLTEELQKDHQRRGLGDIDIAQNI